MSGLKSIKLLAFLLAFFVSSTSASLALLEIEITQGNVDPLPIAVLDFSDEEDIGAQISKVVTADLERTGLFRSLNRDAFVQTSVGVSERPRFGDWRIINALALVTGRA